MFFASLMRKFLFLLGCLFVGGLFAGSMAYGASAYLVTEINAYQGNSLNASGQVAGVAMTNIGYRGFVTGQNGQGYTELATLGSQDPYTLPNAFANGVNDLGQVVGFSSTIYGEDHAFITGPNGVGITDLGTISGSSFTASYAFGVNKTGQVVGRARTELQYDHAFITGPNGVGMLDLGTLQSTPYSHSDARAINDLGQVAGSSTTDSGSTHAFLYDPNVNTMIDLGTLYGISEASGLNNSAQVVGYSTLITNARHAFVTGPNGIGMKDLGSLNGVNGNSQATGINDTGKVVGWSAHPSGIEHAFVTDANGALVDLNSLVTMPTDVILFWAYAINNLGQIVAQGTNAKTYLLTPINQPPVNQPPVAYDGNVVAVEDTSLAIALSATDLNGDALSYQIVSSPLHGVLTGTGSSRTYTPSANYNGPDSFTFKANDGLLDSNIATVTISVSAVNDAPVANADSAKTEKNHSVTIPVLANDKDVDGDVLTVSAVSKPKYGNVLITSKQQIKYAPKEGFVGTDKFTYTVSDGKGGTATATVTVNVTKD